MIIIDVKKEGLDKSIKILKRKFEKSKILKELRDRKEFKKKSLRKRAAISKAIYIKNKIKNES